MERLRQGDVRGAVDGVYREHARDLRAYLRHRLYSEDAVEDLLAEVFQSLMKDLASFRGDSKLRTWLRSVAHHAMLRHFQREQKRNERVRPLEPSDEDQAPQHGLRMTLRQFLAQIYNRLDADDRRLVDLWTEGWSWQEVADQTTSTEEAVRKRFTRLMKRLANESP
jgi:RNA polymerase sigma-70 factor (ECF subfamily)